MKGILIVAAMVVSGLAFGAFIAFKVAHIGQTGEHLYPRPANTSQH